MSSPVEQLAVMPGSASIWVARLTHPEVTAAQLGLPTLTASAVPATSRLIATELSVQLALIPARASSWVATLLQFEVLAGEAQALLLDVRFRVYVPASRVTWTVPAAQVAPIPVKPLSWVARLLQRDEPEAAAAHVGSLELTANVV